MARYRVFVRDTGSGFLSASFPYPDRTYSWITALWRVCELRRLFRHVLIERVDKERD